MTRNSYDRDGSRIGTVVDGPNGEELYLYRGNWHLGTAAGEKQIPTQEAEQLAAEWGEILPAIE